MDATDIFREFSGIEFTLRRPVDTSQAELLLGDVAVIHRDAVDMTPGANPGTAAAEGIAARRWRRLRL